MYGHPALAIRMASWEELFKFGDDLQFPWLVIGDFNDVKSLDKKSGGTLTNHTTCLRFQNNVDGSSLIDLVNVVPRFT